MKFSESLKKNRDFREVYQKGRHFSTRLLTMYVTENSSGKNYLGIVVSKKVGNSVVRHRIKRLIKESYRLHESGFGIGLNIVVVGRIASKGTTYHDIEKSLLRLAKLHRILNSLDEKVNH